MLRLLLVVLLLVGCSGDSGTDGGPDGRVQDYARIEGPTTNPIVDLPVRLDQGPTDLPAPGEASAD